jgi:MoaA/NifB/PqqE/SkfB family radical SAM enzyme
MGFMSLKAENAERNRQEIAEGANVLRSRPLFFWFDLCGPCNLHCAHCGYRVYGRTSEQDVSDAVYNAVVTELLPSAYLCKLGGTNWGEMTLSGHFQRFLRDCLAHEVRIDFTTNGTRMHDEWFVDLLDVLDTIGFSMEGMEDEFEKVRGFKWRHFLKNVEKVCRGRADHNKDFRVEWRYCAHAGSIHQLPDMIRLARSVGVDTIQVMNFIPFVRSQEFNKLYYHRSLANRYFGEARRLAAELEFEVNIPPDFDEGSFESQLVEIGPVPLRPRVETTDIRLPLCYYPWQACSINELGHVKPDCVYWRTVGDLSKHPFTAVWNGRKYRKLRATVNGKPHPICLSCRMPRFDGDQNISAMQARPGLRELARDAMTIHRRCYEFSDRGTIDFAALQTRRPEVART